MNEDQVNEEEKKDFLIVEDDTDNNLVNEGNSEDGNNKDKVEQQSDRNASSMKDVDNNEDDDDGFMQIINNAKNSLSENDEEDNNSFIYVAVTDDNHCKNNDSTSNNNDCNNSTSSKDAILEVNDDDNDDYDDDEFGFQTYLPVSQLNNNDTNGNNNNTIEICLQSPERHSSENDNNNNISEEEEPSLIPNIGMSDFMEIPLDDNHDNIDINLLRDDNMCLLEDYQPCDQKESIDDINNSAFNEESIMAMTTRSSSGSNISNDSNNQQEEGNKDDNNNFINERTTLDFDYLGGMPQILVEKQNEDASLSDAGSSLHGLNLVDSMFSDNDDDGDDIDYAHDEFINQEHQLLPSISEDKEFRNSCAATTNTEDENGGHHNSCSNNFQTDNIVVGDVLRSNGDINNNIIAEDVVTYDKNLDFSYVTTTRGNIDDDTSYKSFDNKSQAAHSYTSLYDMIYDSLSDVFSKDGRQQTVNMTEEEAKQELHDIIGDYNSINTYNINKQLFDDALLPPSSTNNDDTTTSTTSTTSNVQQKKNLDMNKWLSEDDVKDFVSFYDTWKSEFPILIDMQNDATAKQQHEKIMQCVSQKYNCSINDREEEEEEEHAMNNDCDNSSPSFLCFSNIQSCVSKQCATDCFSTTEIVDDDNDNISDDKTVPTATTKSLTTTKNNETKTDSEKNETSTLDSITAAWLWENLHKLHVCSNTIKLNNYIKSSNTANININNNKNKNAYKQAMIEEEMRIEAESVECMRLPVTTNHNRKHSSSSNNSKTKQKIDLDVILEDEMKYLLSKKKGTINSDGNAGAHNGNAGAHNGNGGAVEIKYKLLKGRRPPRPAKKVRSKASIEV